MTGRTDQDAAFRLTQRRVALRMALAVAITTIAFLAAAHVDTHRALQPVAPRLATSLRIDILTMLWLAATVGNVARLRFFSPQDIAGSSGGEPGAAVRAASAILQNTLEQAVLAIVAHLALAATLPAPTTLLMTLTGLFCVGRALFWLGYRRGAAARALGFALTFYPSVAALLVAAVTIALGHAG